MRARAYWIILPFTCLSGDVWAAAVPCQDLLANLKSSTAATRQQAAADLAKQVCPDGIAALTEIVRDPEVGVRLAVGRALRLLHDPDGVPALTTLTRDGSAEVRGEAIRGLMETYSETSRRDSVDRVWDVFSDQEPLPAIEPWVKVDPMVHVALAERLRDEVASIRRTAASALGVLRGRSAVTELATALNDPDAGVRARAAKALAQLQAREAGDALVPLLSDDSADVRSRVMQAVMTLQVKSAAPTLREMYEKNRPRGIQAAALEALSRIGDPGQKEFLLELSQDPDPDKRRWAIEGLARISERSLLAGLKKDFQRERNEDLRLAHAFALTLLGDRAFVDTLVLGLSSRTLGSRCRAYIVELGPGYLEDLYPYLGDPDAGIRAELAGVMGELGDPAAVPHLEPLLTDPSQRVADEANRAVERLRRGREPQGLGGVS